MRPRQITATDRTETGRNFGEGGAAIRRARSRARCAGVARIALAAAVLVSASASVANPLSLIGETFSDWKERLFGKPHRTVDAPADGAVELAPGTAMRIRIGKDAPERDFPKGRSRYRIVELPQGFDHAALRVQIVARPRESAFGHEVFKPLLYLLDANQSVVGTIEVKPLHLDIRPFRRTRLLGCVTLDAANRFAIATDPSFVGKSYESEVRDAIKAPTQGGFYYATDAVKVKLPYAASGEIVLDVTKESAPGKGC
ncbi:MAG TPA: hypothetical protein VHE32_12640 [Rhodanobacteraceae bacterium]|nr:hypothetical protein [Rhodanobacteraceae bacterium]